MSSYLMDNMRIGRTIKFRGFDGTFTPQDALQARSYTAYWSCACRCVLTHTWPSWITSLKVGASPERWKAF